MLNENSKALPCDSAFLATAMQHPQPTFAHLQPKTPKTDDIAGNCVIVEVALNHALQPLPDLCQRLMHSLPKFVLHLFQFGEESLADGLAQHKELAGGAGKDKAEKYVPDDDRQTELRLPARSSLDTAVHKTDFFAPNAQVQTHMTSFRDFQ